MTMMLQAFLPKQLSRDQKNRCSENLSCSNFYQFYFVYIINYFIFASYL